MRRILDVREHETYLELEEAFRARVMIVVDAVNVACTTETCHVRVTNAYRSSADQLEVWKRGRDRRLGYALDDWTNGWRIVGPIVTRAPPGRSAHEYRLAVHAGLYDDETRAMLRGCEGGGRPDARWHTILAAAVESAGLTWGGRFRGLFDAAHIEDPGWRAVAAAAGWRGLP